MGNTVLKCAHAVCTGAMHEARGLPCQDRTAAARSAQACAVALCDGAGSVPGAEYAASAAVRAMSELAAASFETLWESPDDLLQEMLLRHTLEAVRAEIGDAPPACTALLAAMASDGRWLAAHLGDGVILALRESGSGYVLSLPENGATLSTTYFLSGPEPMRHLRVYRGDAAQATHLILSSDGASALLYDLEQLTLMPAVSNMCGWLDEYDEDAVSNAIREDLHDILRQLSHDDLSLAILCRCTEARGTEL